MAGGTYVLVLDLESAVDLEVGALGSIAFESGRYAYVGSAFGPGGFSRIDRHRSVETGDHAVRHWHIDYLLVHASIVTVYRYPGRAIECALARKVPGTVIDGFGASDCGCDGHLVYGGADGFSALDADSLLD